MRSVSFAPVAGLCGNLAAHRSATDLYVEGSRVRSCDDGNFVAVYFGRLVRFFSQYPMGEWPHCVHPSQLADGSARSLIRTFNVKTREYYGNTSMDAELSLLMANQALVWMSIPPLRTHLNAWVPVCPRQVNVRPLHWDGKHGICVSKSIPGELPLNSHPG